MISVLATRITERLCRNNIIVEKDRDLYQYGFFLCLSKGIFFIITILFGLSLGVVWESVVFFLTFSALREYAGGYHASKESICTIITSFSMFICVATIFVLEKANVVVVPVIILIISSIIISILSPQDSKEKPLDSSERSHYKKVSCGITLMLDIVALVATMLHYYGVLYVLATSTAMESVLLSLHRCKHSDMS